MKRIMQSAFETGTPFLFFRDTANRMNPNKHAGMIYCSNLCTEIMQNMKPMRMTEETSEDGDVVVRYTPGDFVVCNLSSLNLGRCKSRMDLERIVTTQIRGMDNVIDLNYYPVKQAEVTNQKYRAIGLGVSGYHQYLAQNRIMWESEAHLKQADELFEWINFFAIKASMELAKEKGPYSCSRGQIGRQVPTLTSVDIELERAGQTGIGCKEKVRRMVSECVPICDCANEQHQSDCRKHSGYRSRVRPFLSGGEEEWCHTTNGTKPKPRDVLVLQRGAHH